MILPKPWQVPKSLNHHYKLCHNVIIENTTILKIVLDGERISEKGSSCTFFSLCEKVADKLQSWIQQERRVENS